MHLDLAFPGTTVLALSALALGLITGSVAPLVSNGGRHYARFYVGTFVSAVLWCLGVIALVLWRSMGSETVVDGLSADDLFPMLDSSIFPYVASIACAAIGFVAPALALMASPRIKGLGLMAPLLAVSAAVSVAFTAMVATGPDVSSRILPSWTSARYAVTISEAQASDLLRGDLVTVGDSAYRLSASDGAYRLVDGSGTEAKTADVLEAEKKAAEEDAAQVRAR